MEQDAKLRNLLRADAPAERDPFFRIALLERRTRQQYLRRQRTLLAAAILAAMLGAIALKLISGFGQGLWSGEVLRGALICVFCIALVAACLVSARGLRQALRQLRRP